jgi:hypothetical protein
MRGVDVTRRAREARQNEQRTNSTGPGPLVVLVQRRMEQLGGTIVKGTILGEYCGEVCSRATVVARTHVYITGAHCDPPPSALRPSPTRW